MKKVLLTLILLLALTPAYAKQFKAWQGYVINKQAVTHVTPYGENQIHVYYSSGIYGKLDVVRSELVYQSKEERNKKLTEFTNWLNEKD